MKLTLTKAIQLTQTMELVKQDAADMSKTLQQVAEMGNVTSSDSINKLIGKKSVIDARVHTYLLSAHLNMPPAMNMERKA